MSAINQGMIDWRMSTNQDGHRDYRAKWLVRTNTNYDGPQTVMNASGLPQIGATWAYGTENDPWAFCWPESAATPIVEPGTTDIWWVVDQLFTTRPLGRCMSNFVANPLSEPQKVGGSFVTYTREAIVDYQGNPILTSSLERIRGQDVERDFTKPSVWITTNFGTLPLRLFTSFANTLNNAPLWGLDARTIKLSRITWERFLYGVCTFFYTVTYEFDINFDTWDRVLKDEGTRVLAPGGDPTKPSNFIAYQVQGQLGKIQLNGAGQIANSILDQATINVQFYAENNFLLLGVPLSF